MLVPMIRAARQGHDISEGVQQRTLDTTKNQLKIYEQGISTLTLPANNGTVAGNRIYAVIEHNLGYNPFSEFSIRQQGQETWQQLPSDDVLVSGGTPHLFAGRFQGDWDCGIVIYEEDIPPATYDAIVFEYKYVINIDPSKDAWY